MTAFLRAYIPEVVALLSSALLVAVVVNIVGTSHAVHVDGVFSTPVYQMGEK